MDGLVPACRVENWEHFVQIMRDREHNLVSREVIYRGQRGCDWPLASTLGRKFQGGSIPKKKRDDLLHQFELAMRGRGFDLSQLNGEVEKWAIGQHHGLHTPLLDWTRSPFVALFFAFNRPDAENDDNPSRAIFCINMSALRNVFPDDEFFIEPKAHNNPRLVNQAGLFTLTLSGEDNIASYIINRLIEEQIIELNEVKTEINEVFSSTSDEPILEYTVSDRAASEIANYVCKIHVPNVDRSACLDILRKMNIHNGSLFPDALGASLFCNDWLDRLIVEETENEAEARTRLAAEQIDARAFVDAEGTSVDAVTALLDRMLSSTESTRFDGNEIANRIDAIYQRYSSIDWPTSPSKSARIRLGMRKLLASLEFPENYLELAVDRIMQLYAERYRRP